MDNSIIPTIVDRTKMTKAMNEQLHLSSTSMAVITIDLHRGHLDPDVATQPLPRENARKVIDRSVAFLDYVRALDIPVIHVVLTLRPIEVATFSFQKAILATHHSITPSTTSDILKHNLEGSIQTDLMPEIGPREGDFIINNKKTASAFIGTDLDNLLRILNIDTLVLIGVNTNTCILSSAFDAFNRGFSTIVNSDCVSSMYGEDLHFFALQNISRCIGWVMSTEELKAKLQDPAEFPVS